MAKMKHSTFSDKFPDRDIAHELAVMSREIQKVKKGAMLEDVLSSNVSVHLLIQNRFGLEAMVVTSNDGAMNYVAIVYRGSNEFEDWVTNFTLGLTSFGYGYDSAIKVHKGFKTACHGENVSSVIEEKVMELMADPSLRLSEDIYVSGHSLGAAMSHIMGVYLSLKHPDIPVKVINFGAPRVGNRIFKNWSQSIRNLSLWRFVYKKDKVPRIPYRLLNFSDAGHLLQMNKNNMKAYYHHTGAKGYKGVPMGWNWFPRLKDHDISKYIDYFANKTSESDAYWPSEFEE